MENKYYFISDSGEPKIVGLKDGSSQVVISDRELKRLNWINEFMWWTKRPKPIDSRSFHVNLFEGIPRFELKKGAKLTDLLSHAPPVLGGGYVISKKFKEILINFDLDAVQFKDVFIIDTKEEILSAEYCLMQIPLIDQTNNIDWKNTFFSDMKYDLSKIFFSEETENFYEAYYFNSYSEYRNSSKIGYTCRYITFDSKFDLIETGISDLIISNRIREELIKNNLTNIEIIPFNRNKVNLKHVE